MGKRLNALKNSWNQNALNKVLLCASGANYGASAYLGVRAVEHAAQGNVSSAVACGALSLVNAGVGAVNTRTALRGAQKEKSEATV